MNSPTASNVTTVALPEQSMFVNTPVYRLADGTVVFGLRQPVALPAAGDSLVPVAGVNENRLDIISSSVYGTPSFWWAIADCSAVVDPLAEILTGRQLRVPAASRLPT